MYISASIMCADYMHLENDIRQLERGKADYLHFDIMDGVFVPNYALGTDIVSVVRQHTDLPLDIHLMVEQPEIKLSYFAIQKGDIVSVHYEATKHIMTAIDAIKKLKAKACIAINPGTPVCILSSLLKDVDAVLIMTVNPGFVGQKLIRYTINKIEKLKCILQKRKLSNVLIEVDGNVSYENAILMRKAGADMFVVGTSSVFKHQNDIETELYQFRQMLNEI
jgi:ribulose-phosphate 3-epimerase